MIKRKSIVVAVVLALLALSALAGIHIYNQIQEQSEVRKMVIDRVDMSSILPGTYVGEFSYGGFTYRVQVKVVNYAITDIEVLDNRTSKHAKMAEGIIESVLERGNVDVDVIAGATTTSRALLRAIQRALECGT